MLEKIKQLVEGMKSGDKPVWLFACLKMDEVIDKWTLVLSAPWINDVNRSTEFQNIIDLLNQTLSDEELSSIAGIAFLAKEDHLVRELLKKRSGDTVKNEKVNGNLIYEGTVIESNPELTLADKVSI